MEDTLYGISAFRYYRVPPHVLGMFPMLPYPETDRRRASFRNHPLISEVVGFPVHLMVDSRAKRTGAECLHQHLVCGELPFGSICETDLGISVASPMLALHQLAQSMSETHLLMAMYELCGTFSVFKPTPMIGRLIEQGTVGMQLGDTWRRVISPSGVPSDLWQRPPLVDPHELQRYARKLKGRRNAAVTRKVADMVTGVVASPFEAQLSILLSTPRKNGGEDLVSFTNNARIALSRDASRVAGKVCCYADFLFEGAKSGHPLVVECQGKVAHASEGAIISDFDRATALQEMGYDVLMLSYSQIADARNFDIVRRLIFKKLGLRYRDKSPEQRRAEQELRRNLFIDWSTLGA